MSQTDDEERNEDKSEPKSTKRESSELPNKMYAYGRELCFILALAFTSYAALQKVIPKVAMSPPASPFFDETSLVADFYKGQLGPALSRVVRSDVSFIMFYAPWDAESQLVRQEFDAAAKYYHREVYFAAVNCWQPESECRHQFPKVHHFPILIVYGLKRGSKGLEYRGPRTMPYMVHFLKSLIHSLSRVEESSDVTKLMRKYDAVVVGFFDLSVSSGSRELNAFHSASIKHLESHPFGNVKFTLVTNFAAFSRFGITNIDKSNENIPRIRLYLWNETLEFSGKDFAADSIVEWIDNHLHTVAIWVSPPGVKSKTLSQFVDKGPVLFLFTPRNPFWEENPNFNTLREVALEYYNCDKSARVMDLVKEISSSINGIQAKFKNMAKRCEPWIERKLESLSLYYDQMEQGSILNNICRWKNDTCTPRNSSMWDFCNLTEKNSFAEIFSNLFQKVCCKGQTNFCSIPQGVVGDKCFFEDDIISRPFDNSRSGIPLHDERVILLLAHSKEEECKRLLHGELLKQAVFPNSQASHFPLAKIQGLACQTNQTISLLALDSLKYHHFAMGLGIDVLSRKHATAVVIVHASGETQHVMRDEFSKDSLVELIFKYSSGALQRSFRSEPSSKVVNKPTLPGKRNALCPSNSVCVIDLTSDTFKEIVLDDTKNVIVLYHSPSCAFCTSIWHVYLTVARIFTTKPNGEEIYNSSLIFARIDGDANDLPWEYTIDSYPSIMFFPAHRKSDSRIFPLNLPMTVSNIAQFIAANLSPEARLSALLGGCNENCIRRAKVKCLGMIALLLASRETTETRLQHIFADEQRVKKLSKDQLEDFKRVLLLQRRRLSLRIRHLRETYFALSNGKEKSLLNTSRSVPNVESVVSSLRKYNRALGVARADAIKKIGVNNIFKGAYSTTHNVE